MGEAVSGGEAEVNEAAAVVQAYVKMSGEIGQLLLAHRRLVSSPDLKTRVCIYAGDDLVLVLSEQPTTNNPADTVAVRLSAALRLFAGVCNRLADVYVPVGIAPVTPVAEIAATTSTTGEKGLPEGLPPAIPAVACPGPTSPVGEHTRSRRVRSGN